MMAPSTRSPWMRAVGPAAPASNARTGDAMRRQRPSSAMQMEVPGDMRGVTVFIFMFPCTPVGISILRCMHIYVDSCRLVIFTSLIFFSSSFDLYSVIWRVLTTLVMILIKCCQSRFSI